MSTIGGVSGGVGAAYGVAGTPAAQRGSAAAAVSPVTAETAVAPAGATDVASGDALLRQRLFGIDDPAAALPRLGSTTPLPPGSTPAAWMTSTDRTAVAGVYEAAQRAGAPLTTVDALARDLGEYRHAQATEGKHAWSFDSHGDAWVQAFTPSDEAAAQRVLHSRAFTDSGLPSDFLEYALDPGRSAGPSTGVKNLERFLYAISPSGDARAEQAPALRERGPDRLARALADGSLQQATAEHARWRASDPMGGHTDWRMADPRDLFERYEHRIQQAVPMLQEDDKAMLGAMYADAEDKYGVDAPELKKIDVAARRLAVLRNMGALVDPDRLAEEDEKSGHPRKTLTERGNEAYDKAMRDPVKPVIHYIENHAGIDARA